MLRSFSVDFDSSANKLTEEQQQFMDDQTLVGMEQDETAQRKHVRYKLHCYEYNCDQQKTKIQLVDSEGNIYVATPDDLIVDMDVLSTLPIKDVVTIGYLAGFDVNNG